MSLNHLTNQDLDIKCKSLELGTGGTPLSEYKEDYALSLVNTASPELVPTNASARCIKVGKSVIY